jgi:hypothetical protein
MSERTFLTPLNEADDSLRECKEALAYYARCLNAVGNPKLADDLADIAKQLNDAMKLIEEGRSLALDRVVSGAHQASVNMVNAALAGSGNKPVIQNNQEGATAIIRRDGPSGQE